MQLIYGMQDIKLLGCEQQKRWEWENIQASLFRINMSSLNLGQWQQVGAVLINEVKNVLITVLSATQIRIRFVGGYEQDANLPLKK